MATSAIFIALFFTFAFCYADEGSGTNKQCPKNDGMTDQVREAFLSAHNSFRSSLALGHEVDALGGRAPKAARMREMMYDCKVEASALKYAKKCIYEHSGGLDRPNLGENIYKGDADLDHIAAAKEASQDWSGELKKYGIGQENMYTEALDSRPEHVLHYTQMAWDRSFKLGCAVVACKDFTYAVCHYGPQGNKIGKPIYTKGTQCSKCPPQFTCNSDVGLCTPKQ